MASYQQPFLCHLPPTHLKKQVKKVFGHDLVPKGVHENRTKGVENKVDDTLKLVVFLDWAQC